MPSSYVYLTGTLAVRVTVDKGGQIRVFFSDNNGLDWKEIATVTSLGKHEFDLSPFVLRRYDYRLRFILTGEGTGLERLKVSHDFQHSQRALPTLGQGKNLVTVTVGPPESTVTMQASTKLEWRGKNLVYTNFHPQLKGVEPNLM